MATAVTEHICSKMIQLFNVSTSMKISRNYVCLRKLLSLFYAVGQERPILPCFLVLGLSFPTLFLPLARISMHAADMGNSAWTLEVLDEGFCLRRYRQAAADPRYSILPPVVLDELKINPKHVPPLRVGGQAGRPKGKRPTRRKASNDEDNTHSSFNAVLMKTPSSTGSAQRKSADPVVAIDGVLIDAQLFCSRISLRGDFPVACSVWSRYRYDGEKS